MVHFIKLIGVNLLLQPCIFMIYIRALLKLLRKI